MHAAKGAYDVNSESGSGTWSRHSFIWWSLAPAGTIGRVCSFLSHLNSPMIGFSEARNCRHRPTVSHTNRMCSRDCDCEACSCCVDGTDGTHLGHLLRQLLPRDAPQPLAVERLGKLDEVL